MHTPEMPTTLVGLVIALALGMAGLLAWVLRYLMATTIPDLLKTFREEMQLERASCKEQFDETLERIDRTLAVIGENHEEYRRNQEEWRLKWQRKHGD